MMLNVLLKLCVLEPKLLMAHVKSYSELMVEGLQSALMTWKLRMLMYSMALASFFFGLFTAFTAILLWAALPVLNEQYAWVLIMLPMFLLLLAWIFYSLAKRYKVEPLFNDVQEQLNLDLLAICQASSQ
jgi:hypothetical protein